MHSRRSVLGNYLQESVIRRIRELNAARSARIDALKSRADAEAYVKEVRQKIADIFDIRSDRSVPAAEVVKVVEADGFRIENIIYFSRENFPVTANLYLPATPGKHPGVVFVCGHSVDGKLSIAYRNGAANLAKKGFVVLLLDPIAQGERWQFMGVPNASEVHGKCTREHNMLGKQLRLLGDYFGSWRALDALRGLDYLLSRSEVDPSRVGITGNSGGGTMTTFVQALDERFTMAAPGCYITSWQRNFENELPTDVEQIPPGILAAGCEMGDFLLAYAPRPILIMGQKNDFFDPRGLKETYEQVKKVYTLLGAEENIQYFIGPTNHGYSIENREAMYEFFLKHAGVDADAKENFDGSVLAEKDLLCTSTGQVMTGRPEFSQVHDLILKSARELAASRVQLDPPALKSRLRELLNIPETISEPYVRVLRRCITPSLPPSRHLFCRFAIESEDGMLVPLKLNSGEVFFHFPELEKLTIYIPHLDSANEVVKIDRDDDDIYAGLDVSGLGETLSLGTDQSDDTRKFTALYNQDYHYDSVELMFGSSMIARRVKDILSAIEFVKARGVKRIELAGRGQGSLPALFAALLSDDVAAVKLWDTPESYQSMVEKRLTLWPQSCMVPGILKYMDLPDIHNAVRAFKSLEIVNFVKDPTPEV